MKIISKLVSKLASKLVSKLFLAFLLLSCGAPSFASVSVPAPQYFTGFSPQVACTGGDSLRAQGFGASPSFDSNQLSLINQLRYLSGNNIFIPTVNNFAVSGSYVGVPAQIPTYIRQCYSSNATLAFLDGGRNDLMASNPASAATVLSQYLPPVCAATWTNKRIILMPMLPEPSVNYLAGASGTLQLQQQIIYNRTIYELTSGSRPDLVSQYHCNPYNLPVTEDFEALTDNTTGYRLAGKGASDGVHLIGGDTLAEAQRILPAIVNGTPSRPSYFEWFFDYYDAINNVNGNLLNNNSTVNAGMFAGTGGSVYTFNGVTPTGTVATYYQALRNSGTSTATYALSKEGSPRSDGITGYGQIAQIDCNAGGSNDEQYRLQYTGSFPTPVAGKKLWGHLTTRIMDAPTNYLGTSISVYDVGIVNLSTSDGEPSSDSNNYSTNYGVATDIYYRTQNPITVQANTDSFAFYIFIHMDCRTAGHVKLAMYDAGMHYY